MGLYSGHRVSTLEGLWDGLKFHSLAFALTIEVAIDLFVPLYEIIYHRKNSGLL